MAFMFENLEVYQKAVDLADEVTAANAAARPVTLPASPDKPDFLPGSSGNVTHGDGSTLFEAGNCPAHGDKITGNR